MHPPTAPQYNMRIRKKPQTTTSSSVREKTEQIKFLFGKEKQANKLAKPKPGELRLEYIESFRLETPTP